MQFLGPQAALTAADQQQAQAQNELSGAANQYNYTATLPYQALNQFIAQITGNYGGTTTATQPYYDNTGANVASDVIGGAGAAGSLGKGIASLIGAAAS
jgi:hypothetical protein